MSEPKNAEVYAAIEIINSHLDAEWISEGCGEPHVLGCVSCQAVHLKRQLEGLSEFLHEGDPETPQ